ncbi:MAG: hypothetical protein SOX20_01665 [Parolsenella sp.]|uniref:hypothetical protein n=1 Tax=unclassified Parolsenella TaxID=2623992 RepID=UPI002A74BED9|nr:hypothetical protein [Parolsenella sp.]MDY3291626.1 hypothetical protein [Parolsenella sp.]
MTSRHTSPAICAGLAGVAAWATPTCANALTVLGQDVSRIDPGLSFAAGCIAGAVIASGTSLVVTRMAETRRRAAVDSAGRMRGANGQAAPSAWDMSGQDATGTLSSVGAGETSAAVASECQPRHAARSTQRGMTGSWEQTGNIRVQPAPHVAAAASEGATAAPVANNHAAPAASASGHTAPASATAQGQKGTHYTVPSHYGVMSDAEADAAWNSWLKGSDSVDYADVAEDYVRKITLAERMAARAKGVASVLQERLGAAKMEGLPVIARADGSVGDVGEAWWDQAFGNEVRPATASVAGMESVNEGLADNSAVLFCAQTPAAAAAAKDLWVAQAAQAAARQQSPAPAQAAQPASSASAQPAQPATPQPAPSASAHPAPAAVEPRRDREVIATRLADPAEAFPAQGQRWSDQQQDLWAVALAALDERTNEDIAMAAANAVPAPSPASFDEELDEVDHLEPDTIFMAFKPQAGRPDVTDTDSYVDMLVDEELARNESKSVRKLAHHSIRKRFKVIDGGTADIPARHLALQG